MTRVQRCSVAAANLARVPRRLGQRHLIYPLPPTQSWWNCSCTPTIGFAGMPGGFFPSGTWLAVISLPLLPNCERWPKRTPTPLADCGACGLRKRWVQPRPSGYAIG